MERLALAFPLLSDDDRATIRAYDVIDEENDIAKPATFVLDADGVIRWKYVGGSPTDRPGLGTILAELCALAS